MNIERVVARLAPKQYGLITRDQLVSARVPGRSITHHVSVGRLERLYPRVFRVPGAPRTWLQGVLGATLSAGEPAAASGVTAAVLWELIDRQDPPIEVTVPFGRHPRGRGFLVRRTRRPFETVILKGIRTTTASRTIADLRRALDPDALEELTDLALRRKLVRGERGERVPESVLERRVLRILSRAGLPKPVVQYDLRRGGTLIAQIDLAYPRERIAIEIDGYAYHSGRSAFDRDRRRQNDLQAAGFAILRFTSHDVMRPKYVASSVQRLLWERGHPDVVSL